MDNPKRKAFLLLLLFIIMVEAFYVFFVSKKAQVSLGSIKISLNQASLSELEILPGLGKQRAYRIYSYRMEQGAFEKAEDLMEIQGVGGTILKKIERFLTIENAQ